MPATYECGHCGKPVLKSDGKCIHCGMNLSGFVCKKCEFAGQERDFPDDRCPRCGTLILRMPLGSSSQRNPRKPVNIVFYYTWLVLALLVMVAGVVLGGFTNLLIGGLIIFVGFLLSGYPFVVLEELWRIPRPPEREVCEAPDDPAVVKHMDVIASQVHFDDLGQPGYRVNEATLDSAKQLGKLVKKHADSPELHYAYAAALQVNQQGAQAEKALRDCVKNHPDFGLAKLTLKRGSLAYWNPFYCPELDPDEATKVPPVLNKKIRSVGFFETRYGLVPRSVLFYRDKAGELDAAILEQTRIEVVTVISEVNNPQVIAIHFSIYDDKQNPLRGQIAMCPFGPWHDPYRFKCEIFVRQTTFDFVIINPRGEITYSRHIKPSKGMRIAHKKIAKMFQRTEGLEISDEARKQAVNKHDAWFSQQNITDIESKYCGED